MILFLFLLILVLCILYRIFCTLRGLRPGSTIVVGNGPSLMGKGLGKVIDSHDNVIRVNMFKVKGYEHDVGSRTTGWHINENLSMDRLRNIISRENISPEWMGSRKIAKLSLYFPGIERYSFKTKVNGCRNFTSGTLAILHMLEKGYNPVYVAGISGTSGAYYFDTSQKTIDRNKKNIENTHCENEEQQLMRQLVREGKVVSLDGGI